MSLGHCAVSSRSGRAIPPKVNIIKKTGSPAISEGCEMTKRCRKPGSRAPITLLA